MPFQSQRAKLVLDEVVQEQLNTISRSRTETAARVERAHMLLAYAEGTSVSDIARQLRTNRPKVERCLDKGLQFGAMAALADLPGRGRDPSITPEARTWVISLACQKPKELGYAQELWTTRLLAQHVRKQCGAAGHPSLRRVGRGTISKILTGSKVRPHKITYYQERRDPQFEEKMAQLLYVYKQVEVLREQEGSALTAILAYDEKPGIQATQNKAPDLPPVPGTHPQVARDREYIRHGTLSLLAGIDLLTGHVHGLVERRHRSREFVQFLKLVDSYYSDDLTIRIVLDNHSAHISKETRSYLASVPNRFDFIFTPRHGSWLNLIESLFAKMAKTLLREIRVHSIQELRQRIEQYLAEINEAPVIFRWKYGLDAISLS